MSETVPEALDLVDIGVNLADDCFDADREAVITRAVEAGVGQMILTGTTEAESDAVLRLAEQYPGVCYATAGIHPHYAKDYAASSLATLKSLCLQPAVCAVGETGLDFNRNFSLPEQQEQAFAAQIELAAELAMPLFVHERDAGQRVFEMLKHYRDHFPEAVVHCFTAEKRDLYRYLDLDLHIGITGWVCDERRGAHLIPLLSEIPPGRLMLETDAPYLMPRDLKPKPKTRRNEPVNLVHICQRIAAHLNIAPQQLAAQTSANARRFFSLPGIQDADV